MGDRPTASPSWLMKMGSDLLVSTFHHHQPLLPDVPGFFILLRITGTTNKFLNEKQKPRVPNLGMINSTPWKYLIMISVVVIYLFIKLPLKIELLKKFPRIKIQLMKLQ